MKTPKADLSLPVCHPEPFACHSERSEESKGNPTALLHSLKTKYDLFAQLKNDGLINQDRHLKMEKELKQAIEDLEVLIPKLEVA